MDLLTDAPEFAEINGLVQEYRSRCLWFLKPDFTVSTPEEARLALDSIERYGDREAYQRAERLRQWLSRHIKAPF